MHTKEEQEDTAKKVFLKLRGGFQVGDKVKLVQSLFGWGSLHRSQVGTIRQIHPSSKYSLASKEAETVVWLDNDYNYYYLPQELELDV